MEVITSGSQIIKTLPSGETFNIEMLDGWEEMSAMQRAYLHAYMDTIGQINMARMSLGLKKSTIEGWTADPMFNNAVDIIDDLFTDGLRALDYMEAVTNGKIRGRVLQARQAKGYEPKATKQTNLLVATGGLGNVLKALSQTASSSPE